MITSSQNSFIKDLKKLKTQKNILCLDNPKLIEEAIKDNYKILYVLKTENITQNFKITLI